PRYAAPRDGALRAYRGAVLLAGACAGLIATAWTAWSAVLDGVADGASALMAREGDGQTQATATVALGAVATLGFVTTWWRRSHPRRAVRLSGGRGRMAVDDIAGELRRAILDLPEVR